MKKRKMLALILTAAVLSGCTNNSGENSDSSEPHTWDYPEIPEEFKPTYEIEPIKLNDYLSKGYDSSKVKQYDKLKVYECSLTQLDKNAFLSLFSEPPVQNGINYSTVSESGYFRVYGNTKPEEKYDLKLITSGVDYHKNGMTLYESIIRYLGSEIKENIKTNVLDFAAREEIENTTRELLKQFGITASELTTYSVTAEEYSAIVEAIDEPRIEWSPAADFYYVNGIMTVDGLPVTYGQNSYNCYDDVMLEPTTFYAVYTKDGLVDFMLNNAWDIGGVISESKILTLEEAEKIITEQYPPKGHSVNRNTVLSKAELFYRSTYTENGLQLIPCWGFYVAHRDEEFLNITVNAVTGEIL